MAQPDSATENNDEGLATDICVVCFKNVEIYSIGECDHPVCYECSTRMRVLCQQNECPICRKSLSKVIFTNRKLRYRELEATNRSEYYNKKFKIAFENINIQNAFYTLLDHPCPMCNRPPFHNFEALRDHVRKEHEHYYCDICVQHLKIFTFERKCYNRHDLAMHRRKGDADNTSHRGHPLCQYCDYRFLDRDELFRHLRKEHYYCHFCDADGSNEFYADYESLREHFRAEHYLCEEGDCASEQFTAVFRTDIDLKAHFASVHGKHLNKQQAKQARTLQLEITLGHRGRSQHDNQPGANLHIRRLADSNDSSEYQQQLQNQKPRPTAIAPLNEEEFPTLGGVNNPSAAPNIMRPNMSTFRKLGPAGLARTKENFPALGPPSTETSTNKTANSATSASAILKGRNSKTNSNGMIIHVSNRPNPSKDKSLNNKKDFPALPSHGKHNKSDDEDAFLVPELSSLSSVVSAKHRSLVDNYVSVVNPSTTSKIQTVQENNNSKVKKNSENKDIKLTNSDFPALSSKSTNQIQQNSWVKSQKERELENRKSKIAPAPILPKKSSEMLLKKEESTGDNNNNKKKYNKNETNKKTPEVKNFKQKNENTKNNDGKANKKNNTGTSHVNGIINSITNIAESTTNESENAFKNLNPPPGFNKITLNSVAKTPNSLTFTTSLGESYKIPTDNIFTPPPNADARNKELPFYFQQALRNPQAFNEFRNISNQFRQGNYDASAYFEDCRKALKNKFDEIFPELLALLPNISKQQDLYLEYQQYVKKNSKTIQPHQKLEMCYMCKQIVKSFDLENHLSSHHLNSSDFPIL